MEKFLSRPTSTILFLCVGVVFAACQTRNRQVRDSVVKEAPGPKNEPQSLGIEGTINWNDIKEAKSAEIEKPWSDTYWPVFNKGIAFRFMADGVEGRLNAAPETLYEYLIEMEKAANSEQDLLNYLSPGEKYDLLASSTANVPAELRAVLKAHHDQFQVEVMPTIKPIKEEMAKVEASYFSLIEDVKTMAAKLDEMSAAHSKLASEGKTEEAKKLEEEIKALTEKVQARYAEAEGLGKSYQELSKKKREATKTYYAASMPHAKELIKYLPMVAEAWLTWASFDSSNIEDYGWMGLCHGWAPAALVEEKPQRAVMVEKAGKKVLFTEGDIRGLLTKIWANQPSGDTFFGARRCESDKYDFDRRGRVLDGAVCYDNPASGECKTAEGGKIIYVKNVFEEYDEANRRMVIVAVTFTESFYAKEPKVAVTLGEAPSSHYQMAVFNNIQEYQEWVDGGYKELGKGKKALVHLTLGCRDTNAMTFHLALTKLLAEKKTGFVMDKTRSSQVWNQPVFKYDLTYLPIVLNKKDPTGQTSSEPGLPVAVGDIKDPFQKYRAPGTAFLVQMTAKVHFGMENGPMVDYNTNPAEPVADEHSEIMEVTYTLELDKDLNLIGGEWGPVPQPGKAGVEANKHLIGGDVPDFLWYYPKGSDPRQAPEDLFDSTFIEQIHQCSLRPASGKTTVIVDKEGKKEEVEIEYASCPL